MIQEYVTQRCILITFNLSTRVQNHKKKRIIYQINQISHVIYNDKILLT